MLLNCDLAEVNALLTEPVRFFQSVVSPIHVLDEVHHLDDPSRVLKIAADEFPNLKEVATGSSTLAATEKFRDSLTGRKRVVHLVPVLVDELKQFDVANILLRSPVAQETTAHEIEVLRRSVRKAIAVI